MTGEEIRAAFLEFFGARGHEVVASSSLIPGNDPSLLFTNAGMVQFKSIFLGDERPRYGRAASSQKCLRAGGKHNDLENVGHTARHHTFFEMLGNFSFGDYFKREAVQFAWDLLTGVFGLPKDALWVSVYEEDDEAAEIWSDLTDVGANRIVRLGAKDNFWQMGDTGPCGPCSEIIIDQGSEIGCGKPDCKLGCECDRYLEIWNLVFMQYDRDKTGKLSPLPRPSIDTGMGLERIAAVLQGKHNNFDSDIFSPIISDICSFSGKTYGIDNATDTAIRVIADHVRAVTFLLAEGLVPSNEGRGYVLRRIIRRASRYAKFLDVGDPVLYKLCESVARSMGSVYPELTEEQPRVQKILKLEEERFNRTLEQGLLLLNNIIGNIQESGRNVIPGDELFKLYDTFGFPIDIARDVASENGLTIDEPGFHREMEMQKTKARASWSVEEAGAAPVYRLLFEKYGKTEFTGYEGMDSESTVLAVVVDEKVVASIRAGEEGEVLLDRTPFYAESGGQVGDTGELASDGMRAVVTDTKKPAEGLHVHMVKVEEGAMKAGDKVRSAVDRQSRAATMRNHTATHLLHAALRSILGDHVKQAGSYVSPQRLRFDFTHFSPLGSEVIEKLEDLVNGNIMNNTKVLTTIMETRKALEGGVIALFGEKYGETVRVLTIRDVSSELCGGTHVSATGDIGLFKILSEGSVASGIRRIEAVTGWEAVRHYREEERELRRVSELLKTADGPAEKLQKILAEMKTMEKAIEKLKGKTATDASEAALENLRHVDGVKVVASKLEGIEPKDLRITADRVRDRMGSGILVLASVKGEQASIVAMVTKDLTGSYNAGDILSEIASAAGGRGGGRPDVAQGGTKDIKKLDKALESLYDIVGRR